MLCDPTYTARELVPLVLHLPQAGAVYRAEAGWSDELELLAALVEQIDALTRMTFAASTGKAPTWPALDMPRPRAARARRRQATAAETRAFFGG